MNHEGYRAKTHALPVIKERASRNDSSDRLSKRISSRIQSGRIKPTGVDDACLTQLLRFWTWTRA